MPELPIRLQRFLPDGTTRAGAIASAIVTASVTTIVAASFAWHAGPAAAHEEETEDPYVFAWPFIEGDMTPRGGTTEGPPVTVVTESTDSFERLRADDLSKFERDRRAILAMAGSYRVSFDFLEIVGYAPGFEPAQPYQSWGTEHVYVVADDGEEISLQHILVMTIVGEDGEEMGPFVTKHWRQDWVYEDPEVHAFRGFGVWSRETRSEAARAGRWSQTVWQVDDSPRYAAWGEWTHTPERSRWESGETWRPLPRREFSVRDDYDVLVGTNHHIVLPAGWVHEQHNVKTALENPGVVDERLAREIGIARYERLADLDIAPADEYWRATRDFWSEVRAYWDRAMEANDAVRLVGEVDGRKLFEPLFERAREIADGAEYSPEENREYVEETVDAFRADPSVAAGSVDY
ncbi:MAG: DUF6607 family protein [Candidatus Wenzhouxiangella sp. M2_3B_020]